jgi:FixJ family two-component response regulator
MEQDILREVVASSSLKQIALKFDLQLVQVETQKTSLMLKFNAATTADLVRLGIYADFDDVLRLPSRFGVRVGR